MRINRALTAADSFHMCCPPQAAHCWWNKTPWNTTVNTNTAHLPHSSPTICAIHLILTDNIDTYQHPGLHLNKVLLSVQPRWIWMATLILTSDRFPRALRAGDGHSTNSAPTLLSLFTSALCLPGNHWPTVHRLPALAVAASRERPPSGVTEPTPDWAQARGKETAFERPIWA